MRYPKECVLKDCEEAVIRPLEAGDESRLLEFYQAIPKNDRWYMRYDSADPAVIRKWMADIGSSYVHSIIALCGDRIVGHGSLHTREFGATSHMGRFRITVMPEFRNKRLGTWIILDLIQLAIDLGLEDLRTDMVVGPEDPAIEAVRKFDFIRRARIKNYAKDPEGNRHDMVIMVKRLHREWSDF